MELVPFTYFRKTMAKKMLSFRTTSLIDMGPHKMLCHQTRVTAKHADQKLTQHKARLSTPTVTTSQAFNYSISFLEKD